MKKYQEQQIQVNENQIAREDLEHVVGDFSASAPSLIPSAPSHSGH